MGLFDRVSVRKCYGCVYVSDDWIIPLEWVGHLVAREQDVL